METRLTVRINGPGVRPGRIALKDLQRIVHPLEQAIRALLPASVPSSRKGDAQKKPVVRLLLSGIGEGSAIADLELDTTFVESLPGMSTDPIAQLLSGIQDPGLSLPPEASSPIDRMASRLPFGIDVVELTVRGSDARAEIRRHDPLERAPASEETRTVSGRLTEVNFASGRARLQIQSTNRRKKQPSVVHLRFTDELAADMQRSARQFISVSGVAQVDASGNVETLDVQRVIVQYDDRRALWPQKRFRWPTIEERIENVDVEAFLETVHGVDEDDV